ncbi:MAG: Zn finger protein HypA/HybF involved in hydrogenase expression, partial [Planctomycetota bacterium]
MGAERAQTSCKHCDLPVPDDRLNALFCCSGCESVYVLLSDEGLTRFYELGGATAGA